MWYSDGRWDGVEHYDSHSKHQILFSSFHKGLIWLDGKGMGMMSFPSYMDIE